MMEVLIGLPAVKPLVIWDNVFWHWVIFSFPGGTKTLRLFTYVIGSKAGLTNKMHKNKTVDWSVKMTFFPTHGSHVCRHFYFLFVHDFSMSPCFQNSPLCCIQFCCKATLWPLIPCWHAAGWEAAGAGLQPGQVILKVNGNNVNRSDHQEVLEHFTAQHTHQEPPQVVRGHKHTQKSFNQTTASCAI